MVKFAQVRAIRLYELVFKVGCAELASKIGNPRAKTVQRNHVGAMLQVEGREEEHGAAFKRRANDTRERESEGWEGETHASGWERRGLREVRLTKQNDHATLGPAKRSAKQPVKVNVSWLDPFEQAHESPNI